MGTLFSALDIARSGLQTAQVQLDTAGHNIANANKEGFSRQRVDLTSPTPITRAFGQIGRGVRVARIERLRDTFLDQLFRRQSPGLADAELRAGFFEQIEDVFLEPGDNGLGSRINGFFDSLNDFANNVESSPVRQSVINEARSLTQLFNQTADRLFELRTDANEEIIALVPEINSLAERIADLNVQIRDSELGEQSANDLRDDRGVLLDELARLVNISTTERSDGQVEVIVTDQSLVSGETFRTLETGLTGADPERGDLVEVRFTDNGNVLNVQDGELFAALDVRDNVIVGVDNQVDTIAATIIEEINRIHSQGNGLANLTGNVSSTNTTTDATTPLDSAGLPFDISAGSFDVTVFDSAGNVTASGTVNVTPGVTTLNSLAADLSAISGDLTATVSGGDTLDIAAAGGSSFVFSNDSSGALASLGINGLFTGTDARTIGVSQDVANDPRLLSSAFSTDPDDTGDNRAALALADVRNQRVLNSGSATINDFYESLIVQVGIDARSNRDSLEVERSFIESFERRRQEVSGVNLDEEVINLTRFQRAFESSARVVTTTDRMLESLLNMAL